jgi:hypothetical protein
MAERAPGTGVAAAADPATAMGEVPAIGLAEEERELVAYDLDVLLPTLQGARRDRYARLREAVGQGQVPGELVPALESLLELTLQTARARARHKADGERTLTELYGRTPAGRELAAHLRNVNQALRELQGQTIGSLTVRMRTVGHFTLTVQTDEAAMTLVARPDTIDVESIAVSG